MPSFETNTRKITSRLLREGRINADGTKHDKFTKPTHPGVTVVVPEPLIVTPVVPAEADNVPETTVSVARTALEPASTSAMLKPVPCKFSVVCSVALYVSGVIVATGHPNFFFTIIGALPPGLTATISPLTILIKWIDCS